MNSNNIQQQTTVNIQEKANLIWAIADKLVGVYKPHEYGNGEQKVESKVLDNDYFKFSKLTIERPLRDENGKIVLKNKKPQADPKLRDTEIIPWLTDTEEYLDKNVRPYAPDFFVDETKTKIGYEIPFTREFYKYVAPRKSSEIFAHLKELEASETELMSKILG